MDFPMTQIRDAAKAILGGLAIFWIFHACANVFFDPLSKFPGPKLAAVSGWWLVYYEVVKAESLTDILIRLHKHYGPVLHFASPEAYMDIYSNSARWDKDPDMYRAVVEAMPAFGMTSYREFKQRRDIVYPYYSRHGVLEMQAAINEHIGILVSKLSCQGRHGHLSNLSMGLRCLAQDIVSDLALGRSTAQLEAPEFESKLLRDQDSAMTEVVMMKNCPTLCRIKNALSSLSAESPYLCGVAQEIETASHDPEARRAMRPTTLLHFLTAPSEATGKPKLDTQSVLDELRVVADGGGETVASAMTVGLSRLVQRPSLYDELHAEIATVWPNPADPIPGIEALERLPLLTATLKESLRLSHGVVAPMPRIVPRGGAHIAGYHVPGGASVGTSVVFVHLSPKVFSNPHEFEPRRWMGPSASGLDKWLLAFSKGPRSCAGTNLAWVMMYLSFATLIRLFRMEYPEDLNDSVLHWRDCFQPLYYGKELRVRCFPISQQQD
ncbi:cytochrome P450 [Xylariaceae sp. FL0662B]|nr:cytochrome P450 [Xylariaceae sp. FL0662B]